MFTNNSLLTTALGLSNLTTTESYPIIPETEGVKKIDEDFNVARSNIDELIKTCMKTVSELGKLADQSQSARFYEALNGTLKTAIEANKALLEIHHEVRRTNILREPIATSTSPQNVTNQLFVGSTVELHKLISEMSNKDG
jgi:hypothetical protein